MDQYKSNLQNEINIIIILGLKLREVSQNKYQMENFLYDRLEFANKLFQSNLIDEQQINKDILTKSCIILSGKGQIGNESCMMKDYLKKTYKYKDETLVQEDLSMTTVENFVFSFFQIWKIFERNYKEKKLNISVVTSDYHKDRSQYILECFLPKLQNAFVNNKINQVKYYGSITNTKEESYLMDLSNQQISEFQDQKFNWKSFCSYRYVKQEDVDLFLEYSKFYQ
ncbi:hypothetical protein ABPG72_008723 [Tetrahymena utriculariae]